MEITTSEGSSAQAPRDGIAATSAELAGLRPPPGVFAAEMVEGKTDPAVVSPATVVPAIVNGICMQAFGHAATDAKRAQTGTFPVYRVHLDGTNLDLVIKSFAYSDFREAEACFRRERAAYIVLRGLPEKLPVPSFLADATVWALGAGSSYLVCSQASGTPLSEIFHTANREELAKVAGEVGKFLGTLHSVAIPKDHPLYVPLSSDSLQRDLLQNFQALTGQESVSTVDLGHGVTSNKSTKIFSEAFLKDAAQFLKGKEYLITPADSEVRFIHGDPHRDHIFTNRSNETGLHLSSVIDFGDARIFDPTYDLVTVHLDLLGGDLGLFNKFLESYVTHAPRLPENFRERMIAYSLVHQFDPFTRIELDGKIRTQELRFSEAARELWGVTI